MSSHETIEHPSVDTIPPDATLPEEPLSSGHEHLIPDNADHYPYELSEEIGEPENISETQHSLGTKTFDVRPDLREIGKSVVRRCQNLPLAVKSLGGLLCTKASPKEWESVLNSEIWIAEEKSEILLALKLSYHYLPPELKQCFAYCAIFPKDYDFDKS
ncbi:Disease resistance protein RGA2 [Forsythia ovata]|uniref:Disease resistance protein RGA2 n=1 Tax=Forsythia ovata TaxID=205694 RepID=A0ABD1TPU7_9LAMI